MNYAWCRADRIKIGATVYQSIADKGLVWVEPVGDLHLRFEFADHTHRVVRRDDHVMFQVCHRRHYETSPHHHQIDAGKALLKVYRRMYGNKNRDTDDD